MTKRIFNWIPDNDEKRDFHYQMKVKAERQVVPESVDLRPRCSPVENQGQMGSCTANALAGNLEFLEKLQSSAVPRLSRLFIYFNERKIEGDPDQDKGAQLRDGIKALKNWGVCPESL